MGPSRPNHRLALALVFALAGCGPRAGEPPPADQAATANAAWHPGLAARPGTHEMPVVSALFAPGAQSAWAWLPDRTLWNGDFGIALLGAESPSSPRDGLGAGLPAARMTLARGGMSYTLRAFMPWTGDDRDTLGWGLLAIDVERHAPGDADTLTITVRSAGEDWYFIDPRAPAGDRFRYTWKNGRVLRDMRTIALIDGPVTVMEPASPEVAAATAVPIARMRAKENAHWRIWLAPVGGLPPDAVPAARGRSTEALLSATAAAWSHELDRGARYRVPDPAAQATLDAAAVCLLGNRERHNGQLRFLGNPFQYRDLYLRDGARVVRALDLLGRADLAGAALATLFEFQWPTGAFVSQRGQLDGTGQALWALAQHAGLAHGDPAPAGQLDSALRAARWVRTMREYSTIRGGPAAGLLPFSDPRDNEIVRGHLLGSDAWAIAGLAGLADVLRAGGRTAEADSLAQDVAAYRKRLIEVWDREARAQGRPLPPAIEHGARDWGNLNAAYPCAVFGAGDPRVIALDRALRARSFAEGLPTYGTRDSVHLYLGFDLTQGALRRGERTVVDADLTADLDHALPDGTGLELLSRSRHDFGGNLPPHGTFAAMYVDLIRSMLVYEDGDSLVVLAGVPARWLAEGATPIEARGAPTRFGPFALSAARTDPATLELVVDLPAPARVALPEELSVLGVSPAGAARALGSRGVALPAGKATWRVQLAASAGSSR